MKKIIEFIISGIVFALICFVLARPLRGATDDSILRAIEFDIQNIDADVHRFTNGGTGVFQITKISSSETHPLLSPYAKIEGFSCVNENGTTNCYILSK